MSGRRRIVVLLVLSSVLLLTVDLRGNSGFDYLRSGFVRVISPLESAAAVVTRPVVNAWRAITGYDELLETNRRLQEQIDAQRGSEIAARNAVVENQQLRELNALESLVDLPTVTAAIIGESPSNIDQVIEIDRGRRHGVEVGMAVVNEAGLVGKVTNVFANSSLVMLITDQRYAVEAKVVSLSGVSDESGPLVTVPSGLTLDELDEAATSDPSAPPSSTPGADDATAGATTADGSVIGSTPSGTDLESSTTQSATTAASPIDIAPLTESQVEALREFAALQGLSLDDLLRLIGDATTVEELAAELVEDPDSPEPTLIIARETGAVVGQGAGRLPQMNFVLSSPTLARIELGDAVLTTGGRTSLAPPDIPIGEVVNIINRPGAAGSQLEIRPAADLTRLQFVRVVLYKPSVEVGQ